ncbi:MAG: tRNA (N6-threonylcarbamoyladenosine(37)-N6)-methyltransferase TrmO [Anaerovoracaceae bacterium]|jgi:tRNA-Thr(GGU) m(6)t(6)A37 methyltransferase TsaA
MTHQNRENREQRRQDESMRIAPVAHIHTDLPQKFGIPRQAGLVPELRGEIRFAPAYRQAEAVRGIEGFSHLWLIWGFSRNRRADRTDGVNRSLLVRPPRLGGREKVGVFASRSPYRPNGLGLSSVRLLEVRYERTDADGECREPVLLVDGVDLADGTPIYDIKPYLAYTDSHPQARDGFAAAHPWGRLRVDCPPQLLEKVPAAKRQTLLELLALDPRGAYEKGENQVYGMAFAKFDVRFTVERGNMLKVLDIVENGAAAARIK